MVKAGWKNERAPQNNGSALPHVKYSSPRNVFTSYRLGELNVIATDKPKFYDDFLLATRLAKRFNLLDKKDRVALFQAILYKNDPF